jgi:hypothetical protein
MKTLHSALSKCARLLHRQELERSTKSNLAASLEFETLTVDTKQLNFLDLKQLRDEQLRPQEKQKVVEMRQDEYIELKNQERGLKQQNAMLLTQIGFLKHQLYGQINAQPGGKEPESPGKPGSTKALKAKTRSGSIVVENNSKKQPPA